LVSGSINTTHSLGLFVCVGGVGPGVVDEGAAGSSEDSTLSSAAASAGGGADHIEGEITIYAAVVVFDAGLSVGALAAIDEESVLAEVHIRSCCRDGIAALCNAAVGSADIRNTSSFVPADFIISGDARLTKSLNDSTFATITFA